MIFRLAWRNIFRNKRRTILSALAVGTGLAVLIFTDAFLVGMLDSMIRDATDTFPGQGQIHAVGFRQTMEVEDTIHDPAGVMASLEKEKILEGFAPRTISPAMLTSATNFISVLMYGVDPVREMPISKLDDAVIKGTYLKPGNEKQILIGDQAADILGVGLGDRVVVTVAQAETGELSQELFRVSGIFRFGVREADRAMAYIELEKSQEILGLGNGIHEIALRFHDIETAGDRSLPFWKKYSTNGNEAIGWRDVISQLDSVERLSNFSTMITVGLIFGVVALIVMNTLFMSLHERTYEFGVLRAIGTRPASIAAMIIIEAGSLSIVSIIVGASIGALANWYFSVHGIDYVGIEFAGVTLRELIYPLYKPQQFTEYPLLVFIFCLLAAIYPAVHAARLKPARAMKRGL